MANLTPAERDLMTQALRALYNNACVIANQADRAFGPHDERAQAAWRNVQVRQRQIADLTHKLGIPA